VLTDRFEEIPNESTDELPTFGVVNDGRKYPCVTARKRQKKGSPRDTLYTVSKKGAYSHLYEKFASEVIEPYFERKRKRTVGSGDSHVNTTNTVDSREDKEVSRQRDRQPALGFPVNTLDR
jgi:hypothetical protein